MALIAIFIAIVGCQRSAQIPTSVDHPLPKVIDDLPGLHNVFQLNEKMFSGSSPEGPEGFDSLRQLGVKTIISVDGAKPDIELARQNGLKYVHVPIGYEGIPREKSLLLSKAVRDLPGKVYIHCHHGKHRGPAAAATILRSLDENCPSQLVLDFVTKAGTDPAYKGLYDSIKKSQKIPDAELARLASEFPEIAKVQSLTTRMVEIDNHWTELKKQRKSAWKNPEQSADTVRLILEHYRETERLKEYPSNKAEFLHFLKEAEASAKALESSLRQSSSRASIDQSFDKQAAICTKCHQSCRDQ